MMMVFDRLVERCSRRVSSGGFPRLSSGGRPFRAGRIAACVSSVACVTTQFRPDLVLLHQLLAHRDLVRIGVAVFVSRIAIRETHVVDLIARPNVLLRRTMAFEAPLH